MEGNVRIVVNDIAASEGGAISILKSLYQYILEADDINEWFFLLSGMYIKETKNVHVLLFKKEKKSRNVYYTVHLNDIYNSYDDKTVSEDDMIEAIKKETTL